MMLTGTDRTPYAVGICAVMALAAMILISPDSYLHDLFGRGDSSWFYLCGKAWMCGMDPYVDFSDSKGPLLWLIYGIGYLLAPESYTGVMWLSVLCYTATLYITYRTLRLWLQTHSAWIGTALMFCAYLNPLLHYEVRAEDFCLPWLLLAMYVLARSVWGDTPTPRQWNRYALAAGMAMGATLMIKFSITASVGILALSLLIASRRRALLLAAMMLLGTAMAVLPFVLYFALHGHLSQFIYEYFVLTFITTSHWTDSQLFIFGFISLYMWRTALAVLVVTVAGTLLARGMLTRWRWWPTLAFMAVFFITVQNCTCEYYLSTDAPFLIFGVAALLLRIPRRWIPTTQWGTSTIVALTLALLVYVNYEKYDKIGNWRWQQSEAAAEYHDLADNVQGKSPTMVWLGFFDAQDVPGGALPGCKYFARQDGETQQMLDNAKKAISDRQTQYVVVNGDDTDNCRWVENCGYRLLNAERGRRWLYERMTEQ